MTTATSDLADFTNEEIREEYETRFGAPDDVGLADFTSADLLEELENREAMPDPEPPSDEIFDLVAEAARSSRHAARAYELLRAEWPNDVPALSARQALISGRMGEAA